MSSHSECSQDGSSSLNNMLPNMECSDVDGITWQSTDLADWPEMAGMWWLLDADWMIGAGLSKATFSAAVAGMAQFRLLPPLLLLLFSLERFFGGKKKVEKLFWTPLECLFPVSLPWLLAEVFVESLSLLPFVTIRRQTSSSSSSSVWALESTKWPWNRNEWQGQAGKTWNRIVF